MASKIDDGCKSSLSSITIVNDDVLISIMFFLPGKDFCRVQLTCKHFHHLLNQSFPVINNYWRLVSLQACDNIELRTHKSKEWQGIYQDLLVILLAGRKFRVTRIADQDKNGLTPLLQACKYDCLHLFKLFMSLKEKAGKCDPNYQLWMEYSDKNYSPLQQRCSYVTASWPSPFYMAATHNSARIVEYMLDVDNAKFNYDENGVDNGINLQANYYISDRYCSHSLLTKLVQKRCREVLQLLCTKSKQFVTMIGNIHRRIREVNGDMYTMCIGGDYDTVVLIFKYWGELVNMYYALRGSVGGGCAKISMYLLNIMLNNDKILTSFRETMLNSTKLWNREYFVASAVLAGRQMYDVIKVLVDNGIGDINVKYTVCTCLNFITYTSINKFFTVAD